MKASKHDLPMTVLAALWLGLFPLLSRFTYATLTRDKWNLTLLITGLTLLTAVITAVIGRIRHRKTGSAPDYTALLPAAGLLCWIVISCLMGPFGLRDTQWWIGSDTRREGLLTQLCYLTLFFCFFFARVRRRWVCFGAAAGVLLFTAVTVLQYFDLDFLGLFPYGRSIHTNYEFQGTLGNIDMCTGYLCLMMPLIGFSAVYRSGNRVSDAVCLIAVPADAFMIFCMDVQFGKLVLLLCALLLFIVFCRYPEGRGRVLTVCGLIVLGYALRKMLYLPWLDGPDPKEKAAWVFSKKAMLAGCGGAFLCLAGRLTQNRLARIRGMKKRWVVLAVALVMIAGFAFILVYPAQSGGLWELKETLAGRPQLTFGSNRFAVWLYALRMAKNNLLFGGGAGTFYPRFTAFLTETGLVIPTEQNGVALPSVFDNPHNEYVALLSNSGLPALLLYLALLAVILCYALRQDRDHKVYAFGVLCYAFQAIFSFSICIVTPMFWVVLGLAASGRASAIEK